MTTSDSGRRRRKIVDVTWPTVSKWKADVLLECGHTMRRVINSTNARPPAYAYCDICDGVFSGLPHDIDPQCRALVEAMNAMPGIRTTESCCGHGQNLFRVWFVPSNLKRLPPLLYFFSENNTGIPGWRVEVYTDASMAPARFVVEGPVGAYADANRTARMIRAWLTSEPRCTQVTAESTLDTGAEACYLCFRETLELGFSFVT